MRGRNSNNTNRKGPNPLTRSYESNGPDVKIRGTAHHIGEKYLQLARDAQSSGDPVMAESYLQHAEHYFRLIAAAQQAQQQAQFGYQRQPGDTETEDDDADEDFVSLPDRFASPAERAPQPPQPVPQPYADRQPFNDRQPTYEPRQDRQGQDRQDRYEQQPRQGGQQERQGGERAPYEQRDRQFDNRRDRNNYQDRGNPDRAAQDRGAPDRNAQDRHPQDRQGQDRQGQDRGPQDNGPRNGQDRSDRPPREFDNRGFRNRNRDFRDGSTREVREPRAPALEEPVNGLPAFITAPTRTTIENDPQPVVQEASVPVTDATDEAAFHLRPRRRRRPKGDFGEGEGHTEAPASDPVGD
jgi:hypothetical protein